jgi:hypothetical protein
VINRRTAIQITTFLATAMSLASAHAHSTREMGPFLSVLHDWLHAGGGEGVALALAVLAGIWLARRTWHSNRR